MNATRAAAAFAALASPHRLAIYRLLVRRGSAGLAAGAIAEKLDMPPSSLTFHLQALQRAGLVGCHRDGRQLIYRGDFGAMNALVGYLTEHCCADTGEQCAPVATGEVAVPAVVRRRRSA